MHVPSGRALKALLSKRAGALTQAWQHLHDARAQCVVMPSANGSGVTRLMECIITLQARRRCEARAASAAPPRASLMALEWACAALAAVKPQGGQEAAAALHSLSTPTEELLAEPKAFSKCIEALPEASWCSPCQAHFAPGGK